MSNDARTPADATRKDKEQTDKDADRKDGLIDDNMISNPQTHRKVSGDHETDTSIPDEEPG